MGVEKIHKSYLRQQQAINRGLISLVKYRYAEFSVHKFCQLYHIAPSTFYAHHLSLSSALKDYEKSLLTEFKLLVGSRISKTSQPYVVFYVFFGYVERHRRYFSAALSRGDMYLLLAMTEKLSRYLAQGETSSLSFLVGILLRWGRYEHFAKNQVEALAKEACRQLRYARMKQRK